MQSFPSSGSVNTSPAHLKGALLAAQTGHAPCGTPEMHGGNQGSSLHGTATSPWVLAPLLTLGQAQPVRDSILTWAIFSHEWGEQQTDHSHQGTHICCSQSLSCLPLPLCAQKADFPSLAEGLCSLSLCHTAQSQVRGWLHV